MNQPWHRRLDESTKAFNAFVLYRDMLPKSRSLQKVCQKLTKRPPYLVQLKKWSSRYSWVARVTAHDDHLAELQREEVEYAIKEMASRQAQEGMALQQVGIRKFTDKDGKLKSPSDLKPRDAIYAIDVGAKIERTARGEPTEIVKGDHTIRTLTDEELTKIVLEGKEE